MHLGDRPRQHLGRITLAQHAARAGQHRRIVQRGITPAAQRQDALPAVAQQLRNRADAVVAVHVQHNHVGRFGTLPP
jgi:hypothetical protein